MNSKFFCIYVKFFSICALFCLSADLCGDTFGDTNHILIFSSQIIASNSDIIEPGSALCAGLSVSDGTVIFRSRMPVSGNFALNGHKLCLESNLKFEEISAVQSWGTIEGNGHQMVMGAAFTTWNDTPTYENTHILLQSCQTNLSGRVTFEGMSSITGSGGVLDISDSGEIKVMPGAVLSIADVVIKGVGLSKGHFNVSNGAEVIFSNVTFEMQDNCNTNTGTFRFKGPSSILVKGYTWTFDTGSSVIIDGVTVWKDTVGETYNLGNVIFADGVLSLLNDGYMQFIYGGDDGNGGNSTIIEGLESCCLELDSRLDIVESCCDDHETLISVNDSRIDLVESCCEDHETLISVNDSRIDLLEECCSDHESRIEFVESCCEDQEATLSELESCCEDHETLISVNDSRIDLLEECCSDHDSRIEFVESCCEDQAAILIELESCCDENREELGELESCCSQLDSRLDLVESCCDDHETLISVNDSRIDLLEECCSDHESRIEFVESCCEDQAATLIELESCCDENREELGELESCCSQLDSRLDLVESCCDDHETLISINDSRIDLLEECCSDNETRLEELESCCQDLDDRIEEVEEFQEQEEMKFPCDKVIELFVDTEITENLIPGPDQTYVFVLSNASIIFDGQNENGVRCISLEKNARMIFKGSGSVILKNNMFFDSSEGYVELFDNVSLHVDKCSQFITDRSQIRFDLFKSLARKFKLKNLILGCKL